MGINYRDDALRAIRIPGHHRADTPRLDQPLVLGRERRVHVRPPSLSAMLRTMVRLEYGTCSRIRTSWFYDWSADMNCRNAPSPSFGWYPLPGPP